MVTLRSAKAGGGGSNSHRTAGAFVVPTRSLVTTLLSPSSWIFFLVGFGVGYWQGRGIQLLSQQHDAFSCDEQQRQREALELSFRSSSSSSSIILAMNTNVTGWKSLDVFVGQTEPVPPAPRRKSPSNETQKWFSQVKQDELVSALLGGKRNGYFVDLAANDATWLSNTYALEQHFGWTGLCIEPNPMYWSDLSTKRHCQIVAAVIGPHRLESIQFRMEGKEFGGIVAEGFDNDPKQYQASSVQRFTVPLGEILERYQAPKDMDYLSLDVEGAEAYVLDSFPFERYRFKVITAERPKQEVRDKLQAHGYEFVKTVTNFGETLWVHTEAKPVLDMNALHRFRFPIRKIN